MDQTTQLRPGGPRPFRPVLAALAAVALVVTACGAAAPSAPAVTDPYEVTSAVFDAPMERVKINVGITATGAEPVEITPDAIELIVDTTAGKGSLHVSLPADALGGDAAALGALGGGDTIDIDALFDGQGLYVKSPLAAALLPFLSMQGIPVPSGDLTGWLKLGTAEEFSGIAGAIGQAPEASAMPGGDLEELSVADLKQKLEESGVTITLVGREQRNGVESDHLLVNVDLEKLQASELAKGLPTDQISGMAGAAANGTLSADVWLDASNGRPNEIAIHAGDGTDKADITVLISDPGDVSLDAPASFVEVPLAPMLVPLIEQFGGALGSPSP
ncbi:MAG TPA: hypothetical protein VFY23_11080 [Candidatus Limnocylindrales bacterium]|nr:hypothetical protein [Candidatus Limnocylindrales bacterium]